MRRTLPLVALTLGLVASAALAADPLVKDFKREWDAAQALPDKDRDRKAEAQVKALERLKGAASAEAAQAAVGVAIDAAVDYRAHDAAVQALDGMTAEPVRAWIAKQLVADKDARVRVLLCEVAGRWPEDAAARALSPGLRDKEPAVVSAAVEALSRVRSKDAVAALVAALKEPRDGRVADDLIRALRALTKQKLTGAAEWEAWWASARDGFSFDAPAAAAEPAAGPSGTPRTTTNGSDLYETISSNRVIFVIDTSFSMRITGEVQDAARGTAGAEPPKKTLSRLEYVKLELAAAIDAQLSKRCLFNVIAFSTKITPWKPRLVEASDANRRSAKAWVAALQPDDETNTYDALETALADKQVDTIYLLTDGYPTHGRFVNPDVIRGEVRKLNATRRVRIHTICYVVGDGKKFSVVENKDMSKSFMKQLAEDSGGFFKSFE